MSQSVNAPGAVERRVAIAFAVSIAALIVASLVALVAAGGQAGSAPPDVWDVLLRTTHQAALSTFFAVLTGLAIAFGLNRLRFRGRNIYIAFLSLGIVAPGIVLVFGIIGVWGRSGWLAELAGWLGLEWAISPFGLHAVILAHTALSGALAGRMLLLSLDSIPPDRLKLGQNLRLSSWQRLALLDAPVLMASLPGISALIFLLCFTSFPIVLILGGAGVTSFELTIFQLVHLQFDLTGAAVLALIQLVICAGLVIPALAAGSSIRLGQSFQSHFWSDGPTARVLSVFALLSGAVLVILPLLAPLFALWNPEDLLAVIQRPTFARALATSLFVAACSTLLALAVAIVITSAGFRIRSGLLRTMTRLPAFSYLAVPAVVLSLGAYLLVQRIGASTGFWAIPVLILGNVLLALPFVLSAITPAMERIHEKHRRLIRMLNLGWADRLTLVEWPLQRRELGAIGAVIFCFSLGDLGIISMFGTSEIVTLPWQIYRAMGAYRTDEAAILAAILLALCLAVIVVAPRLMKGRADA